MEAIYVLEEKNTKTTGFVPADDFRIFQLPREHSFKSYAIETLLTRGSEDLYNYVQWTGLGKGKDMMVLMPVNHYYYDIADLEGVRILVCQKNLNFIKHLDSFLNTIFKALPANAYFLGYFSCNNHSRDRAVNGASGKFENIFMNRFSDAHNEILATRKGVSAMLEGHGFKVIDLTDLNGITYFCSRIIKRTGA